MIKWTQKADAEIKKVPFFVRKKLRRRVEDEAVAEGKRVVGLAEVKTTQQRYLHGMASERSRGINWMPASARTVAPTGPPTPATC